MQDLVVAKLTDAWSGVLVSEPCANDYRQISRPLSLWFFSASRGWKAWTGWTRRAHWTVDREERKACQPGRPCAEPRVRRRMKIMLWIATGVAVAGATFPRWQALFL